MDSLKMSNNPISMAPFVCKWSGTHSKQRHFNTQKELELHVNNDHKDLTNLEAFNRGRRFFICPWKGCKKQQNDINMLKEHLLKHTLQKPFKCPICHIDGSRQFGSLDELNQHSINYHRFSIIDLDADDTDDDMLYDKKTETFDTKTVRSANKTINYEEAAWELFREAEKYKDEPYVPKKRRDSSYVRKNIKFNNEREMDAYMWETYCEFHKGSKKVELINKGLDLLRLRNESLIKKDLDEGTVFSPHCGSN